MYFRFIAKSFRRGLVAAVALTSVAAGLFAQTPIFTPGNIVVSRTTYTGSTATVPFPGSLPNNAPSVADGNFPGVFNNETPDGAFGVTSPIFIDRMTKTGGLIGTIPVSNLVNIQLGANVVTSFPSKSELGLSVTPAGTAVTFMGYAAPANALDVSNSNTPAHVDITNGVNGQSVLIFQRDIVELNANGSVQVTRTNTYSGNNGRNAALGNNGNYFMVGNAGNNGKSVTFAAGTVALTNGSTSVTLSGASSTANMYVGTPFSGTSVPTGTYVTGITDSTHFTISAAATGAASGSYIANEGAIQLTGVVFSIANTNITVADTSKLVPGMPLSGSGFASNSFIASITDASHFVASAATTANSGTGSYTAAVSNSMLSDNTGVQMIQKGLNDTTGTGTGILDAITNSTVVGKVNGTFGAANGYQRGFALTPPDKTGKDDNFRGLTNFNNTLYVSKGSGSNGLDAVYQVNPSGGGYVAPGASAGLPTSANAATASINPLPGWPLTSTGANESKTATTPIVYHPFGMWFANDTTLYVADEGADGVANAAPGGLQKWMYNAGTSQWELKYTLAAASIPSYMVGTIGPLQAGGLRNIAGVNNGDGTVTVFGITSTIAGPLGATLNDEGADPNQLVSITDNLSATSLPAESFTVLKTAVSGEALRGVAYMPGIAVTSSGYVRDRRTGLYSQQVTVQNATNAPIAGPVNLVLDNLSAVATLANSTGQTVNNPPLNSPYVMVPGTASGLAIGASATVTLQFSDPSNQAITYASRVVLGPAAP